MFPSEVKSASLLTVCLLIVFLLVPLIFHSFSNCGTSKTLKKPPFPAFLKLAINLARVQA